VQQTRDRANDELVVELITQVGERYRTYWGQELVPASTGEVETAVTWVREDLGAEVPAALLGFWQLTDGCGMNGANLYGPAEMLETTGLYVADYPHYLMVGDYEDGPLYVYDLDARDWQTLEQGDLDAANHSRGGVRRIEVAQSGAHESTRRGESSGQGNCSQTPVVCILRVGTRDEVCESPVVRASDHAS